MISETYLLSASNADVLAAGTSRLASIPYDGELTLEFQAADNDGTNNFQLTLQLPNGETPIENMHIPKGVTTGAWNRDDKYTVSVGAPQGGHVTVNLTETGTSTCYVRATLMP